MINEEIMHFIIKNKGATVAEIQNKFNVSYREAKTIVDELTEKGDLAYAEGLKYNYTGKETVQEKQAEGNDIRSRIEARRREIIERMKAEQEAVDNDEDNDDSVGPFEQPDADLEDFSDIESYAANDEDEYPSLFKEGSELSEAVADRIKRIVKSDVKMGLKSARKIAEAILDAVHDINDYEIMLIYERIVYEFKNMSGTDYSQLKRLIFTE